MPPGGGSRSWPAGPHIAGRRHRPWPGWPVLSCSCWPSRRRPPPPSGCVLKSGSDLEPFLAGRTTHRRAAAQALAGLACALLLMLAIAAAATTAVGMRSNVGFGLGRSFLFALAITAGAAEFVVVGTLAAQIMPIRARAASLAAGVFGVAFLLRAIADIAPHAHWLVYLSPLGWVEQVRALSDPQPLWLLPIGVFVAAGAAGTIWLAGRRDLGASTWADKDAKEPRTGLLGVFVCP